MQKRMNVFCYENTTNLSENAVLEAYNSGTGEPTGRFRMFKVKYLGDGIYSMRSMLDCGMGWTRSSSSLVMTTIGPDDSTIPATAKWRIKSNANGYYIHSLYGTSKTITAGSTSGANITLSTYSSTNQLQNWTMNKITESYHGVTLKSETDTLILKDTYDFDAVMYSTYTNTNGEDGFTWSVTNGTGSATINSSTGVLTGTSVGTVTVKVKYKPNSYQEWVSECIVKIIPISEGTYFFKNKDTSKYMQPDDGGESHMEQHDFDASQNQRWRLVHNNDAYYYIINDATNKYLTAPDSNSSGKSITEESYNSSIQSRQLWAISEISGRNSYKIQSKNQIGGNLVLAVGWGANWNGINIEQRNFDLDNNYKDEWILQSINCTLSTPLIGQYTTSWCWAASAEMLARTKHPTTANSGNLATIEQEQKRAVYHVFGDDTSTSATYNWANDPQGLKNKGGIYTDVAKAAAFLVGQVNGEETFSGYATPYGEIELLHFLLDGHAVARLYGWATVSWTPPSTLEELVAALGNLNPNTGGHVTVIVGAEWSASEQCFIYTVNDPWAGGSQVQYTYSELLSNTVYNGTTYEISFWFPTVVTKTDYSNKPLLEEVFGKDYSSN